MKENGKSEEDRNPCFSMIRLWFQEWWPWTSAENSASPYRPLLPETDPEQYEKYAEAFDTIIREPVTCIAVTGPYGAGKTSLLNGFEKAHHRKKFKRISLATFEADLAAPSEDQSTDEKNSGAEGNKRRGPKNRISSDQIEKSILQQLIYGVGPSALPYSRFKKIQEPKWVLLKAIGLAVFAIFTGLGIRYWSKIEEAVANYSNPPLDWAEDYWVVLTAAPIWLFIAISIIRTGIRLSFGLSLKKLSIKNAEIETGERANESVFNKHLEEIVYFFQKSDRDIILIEDLDRFQNTEIFTKIREINQLINNNEEIKRQRKGEPIKFVFAIRDDLFEGKDRTKFFDFLIPVIPYVSSGNSYDILHERLRGFGLLEKLDKEFLRLVSIHINDNRHLLNTVNG